MKAFFRLCSFVLVFLFLYLSWWFVFNCVDKTLTSLAIFLKMCVGLRGNNNSFKIPAVACLVNDK